MRNLPNIRKALSPYGLCTFYLVLNGIYVVINYPFG